METKYLVFSGPHYPPAVQIESSTDLLSGGTGRLHDGGLAGVYSTYPL